jgi:hypothetical protein
LEGAKLRQDGVSYGGAHHTYAMEATMRGALAPPTVAVAIATFKLATFTEPIGSRGQEGVITGLAQSLPSLL